MTKIWELSLSPVFLNGPLKSVLWFDSCLLTNSGSSNITARTTGSPSQCANPLWVPSPCADLCRTGDNTELLPHPSWPVLPPSASIPLPCRAQARRAKEELVSIFVAKCCFHKHASKTQMIPVCFVPSYLQKRCLDPDKCWEPLLPPSWDTRAAPGQISCQKWTWGVLFKLGNW